MLMFKKGVNVYGLQPEMLMALDLVEPLFEAHDRDCIVTSTRKDKHSAHSHHYKGLAVDLRSRHLMLSEREEILVGISNELGDKYQVMLETNPDHFHIEYDPLGS